MILEGGNEGRKAGITRRVEWRITGPSFYSLFVIRYSLFIAQRVSETFSVLPGLSFWRGVPP